MKVLKIKLFIVSMILFMATSLTAQTVFTFDAGIRKAKISPRHYGLFFEEINHAGDGGLYAEMIRNRSFLDNTENPDFWWTVGNATQAIRSDVPLNENNPRYNRVTFNAANSGISNEGWWGCNIQHNRIYDISFWVRAEDSYEGNVVAQLRTQDGKDLGSVTINGPFDSTWKKVTAKITATGTDTKGRFALLGTNKGTLCFDCVSLFPPTFRNRTNGCRDDIGQMLFKMKPKFFRFPGGCVIEGRWMNEKTNRFEWKKSIGPIEQRPGHYNANWGYQVSDGLGFDEMLTLAEDLGAEPLFVVNMGMGHGWEDPAVQTYIQEALDAIEYCNGDETTVWGKKRIENGHKEPYNLRLIEIGNENYWFGPYSERYRMFQEAIHKEYPYIEFVGDDAWIWGHPWPVDIVDQHYYKSPSWFRENYGMYDNYSRAGHKVYVGEYAVTSNFGFAGNLDAALGEAVFMMGMENNSDVVIMNSYAPMFTHEDSYGWRPDMIRFNCNYAYGTPSYHVQQMMGANVGDENIAWEEYGNNIEGQRGIALSSWATSVKYDNIKVTDTEGNVLYENDFSDTDLSEWTNNGGTWKVTDGELCQTSTSMQGKLFMLNNHDFGKNYTFELDATKVSGGEGFLVAFNVMDASEFSWWNIGGWGNTQHAIECSVAGGKSLIDDSKKEGSINSKQTYHLKIVVNDKNAKCYIDDQLIHDCNVGTVDRNVYVSSNITSDNKTLFIKAVNYRSTSQQVVFNIKNATFSGGIINTLTSTNIKDENTISSPNKVIPKVTTTSASGESMTYNLPAHSLCIFKMNVKDVQLVIPEMEDIPDPILKYSFETLLNTSDTINGKAYKFTNVKDGKRVTMTDGNMVYFTAEQGYASLGKDMAQNTLAQLTGDYSISIDILLPEVGNLGNYCWAYALFYGTSSYIGLVSARNNVDWYYELAKSNTKYSVHSNGGLRYSQWHNVVLSQKEGVATLYIDGYPEATNKISVVPSEIAKSISAAYIGKSAYGADAILNRSYFDDFTIYNQALTPNQIKQISDHTALKSTEQGEPTAINRITNDSDDADILEFNINGTPHTQGQSGIIIRNGKKYIVK